MAIKRKRAQVSIKSHGEFTALSTLAKRNRDKAERLDGRLQQFVSALNEVEAALNDERDWLSSVDMHLSDLAWRTGLRV